jgi:GT2 family glycosyltransferase
VKLAVVTVNYNSTDYLVRCLDSVLARTREIDVAVVVVDNASDDQSFDHVRSAFPNVSFILNRENLGFATGCNQGIRALDADFYLLLNPDCVIQDAALDRSAQFLSSHPDVGVLGCRVNNPDGTLQRACRRRIPRPSVAFYRFTGLSTLFPHSPRFGAYNLGHEDANGIHEVEAVSGSFLMFRRELIETVGYLDETFFMYGEDLDFCYRSVQAGWKIYYYPEAEVTHFKRASSSRRPRESNFHFYNAMRLFYRKHFYAGAGPIEHALVLGGIQTLYLVSRLRLLLSGSRAVGSSG